jgi:pimeloyl-ACP methyl ester carboxylesterase
MIDCRTFRARHLPLLLNIAIAAWSMAASPAFAAPDCGALANLKIENANLLSATEVAASGDLPAYCRVLGYVRPAINFEIRLPLRDWNGKLYEAGCGGFCGTLNSDVPGFTNAMNFGLRRGYAVATSDSGHWGTSVIDGRWAMNNPVAQMDWGQRSVPETARVAKAVIKSYYGVAQKKAYFAGCSTGGRMAVMAALRNPKEFDGIISGAPALDYTGLVATFFAWVAKANTGADGKPIFPPAKVKLLGDAVYAACGEKNTVAGGIIADPRACHFDPKVLQCRAGDALDCLTQAEVGVVEKWYRGAVDSHGQRLYAGGIPLGSEPHWRRWLTGTGTAPALLPLFAQDFLRYMAFEPAAGSSFKVTDFDFDRDPPRMTFTAAMYNAATFNPTTGATDTSDLAAFREAGGKLIIYHGWADSLVTPQLTVGFYEALASKNGGVAATQDFARLFMVPGMDHCGIQTDGPGIADTGLDVLTALEHWAEDGKAPTELIATKTAPGGNATLWQRPVCAYPTIARYRGSGNPNDAASYACGDP